MSADRVLAGRYRLLGELGRGGMGRVWRAYDETLRREVAVKEVRAPEGMEERDVRQLYTRLEREGWAAGRIAHRNVVTVYDVVSEEGRPWIVMELIRGLSLDEVLDAEGPLAPERAAAIGADILGALRAAHSASVLHRDVKPGNVLLANDGRTVLTDFGIALIEGSSALTLTGELVGSPEYLAPERALGRPPGAASDLWSLGVLLYAAVEGGTPFRRDTALSTLRAIVDEELPPPRRAGPLTPVLDGLLRKDPAERLSAEETAEMLAAIAAGGAPRTAQHAAAAPPVYTPTVSADQGHYASAPTQAATPSAGTGSYGPPPAGGEDRRKRGTVWLAVLAAVAAILAGALFYAYAGPDGSEGGDGGGASDNGGKTGGADGGTDDGKDTGGDSGGGSDGGNGGEEHTASTGGDSGSPDGGDGGHEDGGSDGNGNGGGGKPPQKVTVTLHAVRDSYEGACPPPQAEAPYFTGSITVTKLPTKVEYRWYTGSGKSSDPGWKTLTYPAGGAKQRTVNHTETAYEPGGARSDWISLEVRAPQQAESGHVKFTITCEAGSSPTVYQSQSRQTLDALTRATSD
ncbi:serine/threonine-protein kinase [Streptomyces albiaxialis]|uniref:non-specific serine/threonine protein kinase n=1 Tax=Streptomyces albiaxialis TaxID=329523 RepID=A0ABN2W1A7_9ACTN